MVSQLGKLSTVPGRKKYFYLILFFLLGATLLVLFNSKGVVARNDTAAVGTKEFTVKKGDLKIAVEVDGKAEFSLFSLKTEIPGTIKEIAVKAGDTVKKGDVIARLDAEKYQIELNIASANHNAALARLEKAKEDYNQKLLSEGQKLDVLRKEYRPMQEAPELFSKQEITLKKTALEYAEKSYEEVKAGVSAIRLEEANVNQSLGNLDKARRNLKDTTLTSPVNGRVLAVLKKEGETVSASSDKEGDTASSSAEIAVLSADDGVYVTANVLELDMASISTGQGVEVKFEARPDKTYTGRVTEIENLPVNDPSGVVAYKVTTKLSDPDDSIRSGMTAVLSFIIEQKKDVVIIPNQAVKRVEGTQVVDKVNPDGSVASRKIKTGFTDGRNVEVLEGLEPGDKIIIGASTPAAK